MKKDWKSTLAGLAGAGLNLYANGAGHKQVAFSLGLAVLGALAADAQKVGKEPTEDK